VIVSVRLVQDLASLVDPRRGHSKDHLSASITKPVFLTLEHSLAVSVTLFLFVDEEVQVSVDGVLDGILASELATLRDLSDTDQDGIDPVVTALAKVNELFSHSNRGLSIRVTWTVLPVVLCLKTVHDQEKILARLTVHHVFRVSDRVGSHFVLSRHKTRLQLQPLSGHLDLVQALFTSVKENSITVFGEDISQLEGCRGLSSARSACEQNGLTRDNTLLTERIVDPVDLGEQPPTHVFRDLDFEDIRTLRDAFNFDVQVHDYLSTTIAVGIHSL